MQQMEPKRRLGGAEMAGPLPGERGQKLMVCAGHNDRRNVERQDHLHGVDARLLRRHIGAESVALALTIAWGRRSLGPVARLAMMVLTARRAGKLVGHALMAFCAVRRRVPTPSSNRLDEEQTRRQIAQDCLHIFTGPPLAYHYEHRSYGQSNLAQTPQNLRGLGPRSGSVLT